MRLSAAKKRSRMGYIYILPWLLGLLIFQLYPLIASFAYSFTEYRVTGSPKFIGLSNYLTILKNDDLFWQSLAVTFKYVLMAVPLKIIFALFVAIILSQKLRGINWYRTAYYIPSIFGGSVAVSILWRFLFMEDGLVNRILAQLNIPSVPWLSSPHVALLTLVFLSVWQFGSSMVLFLAALKQVPEDLYEAARIDGASRRHIFWHITLPMISPILSFNVLMQMINGFQDFTGSFVITGGGPLHSTYMIALKLYNDAFAHFKMGYASALSWILFLIIFLITAVFFKFTSAAVYYEDGGNRK
ncbi:sugar ABC transporter permease [Oscillospiraceae bacterium HV4-5-C5C]|nr:sugar ABC transporter permease [Oscillospiraceae bacterium HV4-5-C5C]